jgi:hypothetical protein
MKINFLQLIVGLIVGVLLVGLIYYGAYYLFEKYQTIRHPFQRSKSSSPPPSPSPSPTTVSLSEGINSKDNIGTCESEYIIDSDVFLKVKGKTLALDETLTKIVTTQFNPTDKYQKWRIIFYKDPNNPFGRSQGFIYNVGFNKYLSFENSTLVLKDIEDPIDMKCPVDNFRVELVHFQNQISNLEENIFLELQNNTIITTSNRKKACDFFVTYL